MAEPPNADRTATLIGRRLREFRKRKGLTLVELAARTGLSHPFLSQIERGQAVPRIASLESVAAALDASLVDLLAAASFTYSPTDNGDPLVLIRAGTAKVDTYELGTARLLVDGTAGFMPLEVTADNTAWTDAWVHSEDEFTYVLQGSIEFDLGVQGIHVLHPGDSLYYRGGTTHRTRSADGRPYRVLIVKQIHDS
jgi:transcriptional regulator with XRE-family HTH domain